MMNLLVLPWFYVPLLGSRYGVQLYAALIRKRIGRPMRLTAGFAKLCRRSLTGALPY